MTRSRLTEAQEALIDQYLRTKGLDPIKNPDEASGSGDRIINGELTEYKTISGLKNPNSDTISGAIANRAMNARSQAPNVVIDARRQSGMTREDAIRGVNRAFGADSVTALKSGTAPKLASIRIIYNGASGPEDTYHLPSS